MTAPRPYPAATRGWRRKKPKEVELIDLRNATPEERRYALLRGQGASKERARRLAEHPELAEIGAGRRQNEQHEAKEALALEGDKTRLGLFQMHHIDWLHISTPQRDKGPMKSGHPDYLMGGIHIVTKEEWMAFLEIKHGKLPGVKGIGSLSVSQRWFHDWLRRRGQEVLTAWLPDDLRPLNDWLEAKTGRRVDIDGLITSFKVAS